MIVYGVRFDKEFDEMKIADGIYLHGQLERINGYDMCSFGSFGVPEREGIYECRTVIDENMYISKLFYWTVTNYERKINRGLVVFISDKNGMEEAQKMYDERKAII